MKRMGRTALAAMAVAALVAGSVTTSSAAPQKQRSAPLEGEGEGLEIIANIEYLGGSDMEFATIKGRDYAFAGSAVGIGGAEAGALRVIDITKPAKPKLVATLKCSLYQMDVQISHDGKTLILAQDGSAGGPDACLMAGKTGFMTVDIRNPKKPKPLGVAEIPRGSHNVTAHPKKPYVYNSDSDLQNPGEIQIWSIKNPKKPELINTVPSLPHSPHDVSFNKDGTRAVTAAVSHIDVFNTEDPENPTLMWTGQCPGCSITHDAKFSPDGDKIIVGDEGGGGLAYPCPGGALYFYDFANGQVPILTGIYEPDEFLVARDGQTAPAACTSHVFDISDDGTKLSISWYSAGTRYLDISSTQGLAIGGTGAGITEAGWFMPDGGMSWSSKMYKGPYIYSNDILRGFDVFKITDE